MHGDWYEESGIVEASGFEMFVPTSSQLKNWVAWVTKRPVFWGRKAGKLSMASFIWTGRNMIYGANGRLTPTANLIYSRAMKRMATDAPEDIVRDLESQIKLLVK